MPPDDAIRPPVEDDGAAGVEALRARAAALEADNARLRGAGATAGPPPPAAPSGWGFLPGGGEVGALMRAHDWSTSPLGSPATWPQSLRAVVALMADSRHPMFVAWGAELAFLYNDGYAPILGAKHPRALGRPFREVWAEIWGDISPLVERALAGEATWNENLHLVMGRHGYPEDTWYSFSYSPVRDESGRIAGMFCACTETTEQVRAERRQAFRLALEERLRGLASDKETMAVAAEMLGRHLSAARAGYAELEPDGDHTRIEDDWRAEGVASVAGRYHLDSYGPGFAADYRAGRAVVIDDFAADPRSAGLPAAEAHAALGVRAQIAVPLVKSGRLAALLFVHSAAPRRWTGQDVALVREVAERTWTAVERARAEAALKEQLRLNEAITGNASVALFIMDERQHCVFMNQAAEELTGYALEEVRGRALHDVIHHTRPDGSPYPRHECPIDQAFPANNQERGEEVFVHKDGRFYHVAFTASPMRDDAGKPVGTIIEVQDITERKRAEEALKESEERFRGIAQATSDAIWDWDMRTDAVWWSEGVTTGFGHPREGVGPDAAWWYDNIHPGDRHRVLGHIHGVIDRAERYWEHEYRFRRGDGGYADVFDRGYTIQDEAGRTIRMVGGMRDVTGRKRAEEALRESEGRFRRTADTAPTPLWVTDAGNRLTYLSRSWYEFTGQAPPEPGKALGPVLLDALHPDDRAASLDAFLAAAARRGTFQLECRFRRADGEYRWAIDAGRPHFSERGEFLGYVGSVTDIHERKEAEEALARHRAELERLVEERTAALLREVEERRRAEEALRQGEKLQAIGQLTGGIAHDFNNILQVVTSGAQLLRMPRLTEERRRVVLDGMAKATQNAKELTGRLLAFARKQSLQPEAFDLNARLAGMSELLRHTLGSRIRVETDFAPDLPPVMADPSQFEVALLNLAVNARDAMLPEGGVVALRTRAVRLEATSERAAGDYVCVAVEDTGPGIPPAVMARVFEPFFTTKGPDKGTGLGLAQVHGFAKQSRGDVSIESAPGEGTTVTIHLPRAAEAPPRGASPPAARAAATAGAAMQRAAGRTVLVVDDNPDVAAFAASMLEGLGYATRTAANAGEALALLDARDATAAVDAVFSDVVMPGEMNGVQLAAALRRRHPRLAVVLATGYSEVLAEWNGQAVAEVLGKPYRLDDLAAALDRAFAAVERPELGAAAAAAG